MLYRPTIDRRTKIIATLGPASSDPLVLKQMCLEGVDMIRINASHAQNPEDIVQKIRLIRQVASDARRIVGIILDLQGPKIRVGAIQNDAITVDAGDHITVVSEPVIGTNKVVSVSYPNLAADVKPGELLFVDDGKIQLKVCQIVGTSVECEVVRGGVISNKKGVNLPHTTAKISPLTDKDIADAIAGVAEGVDYIALSFVSQASDVFLLRKLLADNGGRDTQIAAKIERRAAMENLAEIVDAADAVMVARGDLGVEIDLANVPKAQKMIIREANRRLKPVIVATQMLESMIHGLTATRAEVSDVANAIYDHCDAVMLSGETATGIDPANVIRTMADICLATDNHMMSIKKDDSISKNRFAKTSAAISICAAADQIAEEINASRIIAFTSSGATPLIASKLNPIAPIISPTDTLRICQRMALYRGVIPMMMPKAFLDIHRWTDMIHLAIQEAKHQTLVEKDDVLVVTAGIPIGQSNGINSIRVITA
ncbi:pyruvate kinase [bacterium]|nr:pyruvate kinase [bacterium]